MRTCTSWYPKKYAPCFNFFFFFNLFIFFFTCVIDFLAFFFKMIQLNTHYYFKQRPRSYDHLHGKTLIKLVDFSDFLSAALSLLVCIWPVYACKKNIWNWTKTLFWDLHFWGLTTTLNSSNIPYARFVATLLTKIYNTANPKWHLISLYFFTFCCGGGKNGMSEEILKLVFSALNRSWVFIKAWHVGWDIWLAVI